MHEVFELSADLLHFAPIPGLEDAARILLGIWDAVKMVDVSLHHVYVLIIPHHPDQINRLACLRLTERCATALISIREEIAEAGDDVGPELRLPLVCLME